MTYTSEKLYEGFSACFRQWKADGTHCKYLHGYAISFRIVFEGELDERNWVFDFGGMKRSEFKIPWIIGNECKNLSPDEWMRYMFDHTTIIAIDDPNLIDFVNLSDKGAIQLRVVENVGCERFAQLIYETLNPYIQINTNGRVKIKQVTIYENNKNSATYYAN